MRYEQRCSGCNWLESEGHAKDCVYDIAELAQPAHEQNARFAIDGAIAKGKEGIDPPPSGHWLTEYWMIGQALSGMIGQVRTIDTPEPCPDGDACPDARKYGAVHAPPADALVQRLRAWDTQMSREAADRIEAQAEPVAWRTGREPLTRYESDYAEALMYGKPLCATPPEQLASQLIAKWCEMHDRPIPWAKAVEITAIICKLPEEERARLLALEDQKS